MEYEQRYNEALERARQIKDGKDEWRYSDLAEITPALTEIFPELRESEDERIRKWLADYFSSIKATVWIHRDITCEQILDWLKSLRPSWKPSEEQMEALAYAIQVLSNDLYPVAAKASEDLESLREYLKKL